MIPKLDISRNPEEESYDTLAGHPSHEICEAVRKMPEVAILEVQEGATFNTFLSFLGIIGAPVTDNCRSIRGNTLNKEVYQ